MDHAQEARDASHTEPFSPLTILRGVTGQNCGSRILSIAASLGLALATACGSTSSGSVAASSDGKVSSYSSAGAGTNSSRSAAPSSGTVTSVSDGSSTNGSPAVPDASDSPAVRALG
jgi:hypothetical protein